MAIAGIMAFTDFIRFIFYKRVLSKQKGHETPTFIVDCLRGLVLMTNCSKRINICLQTVFMGIYLMVFSLPVNGFLRYGGAH